MKRKEINILLLTLSIFAANAGGQVIIADHTIVDDYDIIPQQYIDSIKKMWVTVPGESHSGGYRRGMLYLENIDSRFQVNVREDGTPDPYTDVNLRFSRATWGSLDYATGWIYNYGEEDWFTNPVAIERTKAGLAYANANGLELSATGFGWCWDMSWINSPGGTIDPVYQVRWAGSSTGGTDGNKIWGLDSGDSVLTNNRVNMDAYLNAMEQYIAYCEANQLKTKIFFTTGPVDNTDYNIGERGYQRYIKTEYIRDYVQSRGDGYLFDFSDILSWNNGGQQNQISWTDYGGTSHDFEFIHPDNMLDLNGSYVEDGDHIGEIGTIRLAKAMWWMLARMAGWDGYAEGSDHEAPSVPQNVSAVSAGETAISLSWDSSTDNVEVAGYYIYRDGSQISSTTGLSYNDTGLNPGTSYSYTVSAFDSSGNESAKSTPTLATTDEHITTVTYSQDFVPGFNWFSVNVWQEDMSLGNCLYSNIVNGDYIKNQVNSSTYYDGYGWFGRLTDLDAKDLYLIKVNQACSLSFTGEPVDPDTAALDLSAGWNWIGFIPASAIPISEAFSSLTLSELDYIKGQTSSATYYEASGWFGTLNELDAGEGYMIKLASSGTLVYPPEASVVKKSDIPSIKNIQQDYLNVHDFEYNGSLTARVLENEEIKGADGDLLLAYVGDECRGVTAGLYFSPADVYLFPIMIYSNVVEGETMSFRYYEKSTDSYTNLSGSVDFYENMVIGDAYNTVDFELSASTGELMQAVKNDRLRVYPNPFAEQLQIEAYNAGGGVVRLAVYDLYGRELEILSEGSCLSEIINLSWDASAYPAGTYFIRMTVEKDEQVKRVVLLK